jgi:cyclic dehypoxanthinyl futalosine synthase
MAWNSSTALEALRGSDLLEIGASANQMRRNLHPENVVTYELRGMATSLEEASREASSRGAGSVDLSQIRDTESVSLESLQTSLLASHKQSGEVTFHRLPISTMQAIAGSPLHLTDMLHRLHEVGLRSLNAHFNPAQSPVAFPADLSTFFRAAAQCDLFVSFSITVGNSESLEQRINTIAVMRALQQESHAIRAVLVRVHRAATPEARREEEATAVDYLKTLAVARLFLDNIEHLQTDWSVMGPKVLELALHFGADDAGSIPWSQAGSPEPSHHGGESELRRIIRDAGFRPVERDALFRQSLLR